MHFSKATIIAVAALLSQGFAMPLDARSQSCTDVMTQCKAKPDPNMAGCAAETAKCCGDLDSTCRTAPDAK